MAYFTLSNSFSNCLPDDFILRTVDDTRKLVLGNGYGIHSNAAFYIYDNRIGIHTPPNSNNIFECLDSFVIDMSCNVGIQNTLFVNTVSCSNFTLDLFGQANLPNIFSSYIDSIGSNILIGSSSNTTEIRIGCSTAPQAILIGGTTTFVDILNNEDVITVQASNVDINTTTLATSSKTIVLNKDDTLATDTGIDIYENGESVGYIKTSFDRNSFRFKTPLATSELLLNLADGNAIFNINQLALMANFNVGIGTTDAVSALTVNGDIQCSGSLISTNLTVSATATIPTLNTETVNASGTSTFTNATITSATIQNISTINNIQFSTEQSKRKLVLNQIGLNEHQISGFGYINNALTFQTEASTAAFVFASAEGPFASSELMRLTGTGRLGIGNTLPNKTLDVTGDAYVSSGITTPSIQAPYGNSNLILEPYNQYSWTYLNSTNSNGGVGLMGNHVFTRTAVGINTTTPQYLLDVAGTGSFRNLRSTVNDGILTVSGLKQTTGNFGYSTFIGEHIQYNPVAEDFTIISNGQDAAFSAIVPSAAAIRCFTGKINGQANNYPLTASALNLFETFTILPIGIGIGTSSPETKVHIKTSGQNAIIRLEGQSNFTQGLEIYDTALRWSMLKPQNTTDLQLNSSTNNLLSFKEDGKVGVGTTDPQVKFHIYDSTALDVFSAENVNGSVRFLSTGELKTYTSSGLNIWTAPTSVSDVRLKEHITDIKNPLQTVCSMRGVSFDFKPETKIDDGRQIGFIAQELQEILPEVVRQDADSGYYRVNYEKITPILVESIKELNKILQEQKKEMEDLRLLLINNS